MRFGSILISLGFLLLLLQACGGGGGGGNTPNANVPTYSGLASQAGIDTSNSRDLTTAATSGANEAIMADLAKNALARSAPTPAGKLYKVSHTIAEALVQSEALLAAKTTSLNDLCDAGGTASANSNDAETQGRIIFNQCGISDGMGGVIVLTGTVDFVYDSVTDEISMVYHVTGTFAGESVDINMSLSCSDFTTAVSPTCEISTDFAGLDDRIYRVKDISVSGNATSGYNVSATVYDPDHGYVGITTSTPLIFDCGTNVPSTGTIELTGASATSATINFVSCDEYNVTIDGVGETFYW
jgi:hypothetical protein